MCKRGRRRLGKRVGGPGGGWGGGKMKRYDVNNQDNNVVGSKTTVDATKTRSKHEK